LRLSGVSILAMTNKPVGTVIGIFIHDGGVIPLHNAVSQQMMPDFFAVEGIMENLGNPLLAYVQLVQAEAAADLRLRKQLIGFQMERLGNQRPFFVYE